MYIITHFGMVLSENNGEIIQKYLDEVSSVEDLVSIKNQSGIYLFNKGSSPFTFDSSLKVSNKAIADDCLELIRSGNKDFIFIKTGKGFLSALPDKNLEYKEHPRGWEEFRILSKDEVEKIIFLSKKQLLLDNKIISFKANETNIHHLCFGHIKIKIDDLFEEFNKNLNLSVVFFDEYIPFLARVLNPALVYVIYGMGDIFEQFKLSIESLSVFGEYKGKIFIATDVDEEFVKNICNKYNLYDVSIIKSRGFDRLDFVGSRIPLLASDIFSQFQPILYVDCDVIFNKKIRDNIPLFMEKEKISAQIEKNHYIKSHESNGSRLYSQYPFPLLSEGYGFNAGIIMIPTWEKLNYALKIANRMLISYTIKFGRDSVVFYDQSIMNYVFHKLNVFDGSSITNCVSIPVIEDIHDQEKGFVHFWPHGGSRSTAMREYVAYLHEKFSNEGEELENSFSLSDLES